MCHRPGGGPARGGRAGSSRAAGLGGDGGRPAARGGDGEGQCEGEGDDQPASSHGVLGEMEAWRAQRPGSYRGAPGILARRSRRETPGESGRCQRDWRVERLGRGPRKCDTGDTPTSGEGDRSRSCGRGVKGDVRDEQGSPVDSISGRDGSPAGHGRRAVGPAGNRDYHADLQRAGRRREVTTVIETVGPFHVDALGGPTTEEGAGLVPRPPRRFRSQVGRDLRSRRRERPTHRASRRAPPPLRDRLHVGPRSIRRAPIAWSVGPHRPAAHRQRHGAHAFARLRGSVRHAGAGPARCGAAPWHLMNMRSPRTPSS